MILLLDFIFDDNVCINIEAFECYLFMFFITLDYALEFYKLLSKLLLLILIVINLVFGILG